MPTEDQAPATNSLWNIRLLRFASGGLINLCIRLLLVYVFTAAGLALWLNYAIVHAITLAVAFFYHSKVTFGVDTTLRSFLRFVTSVIVIRGADYAFVLIASQSSVVVQWAYSLGSFGGLIGNNIVYINVILASAIAFVFRYLVFIHFTFRSVTDGDSAPPDNHENRERR